MTDITPTPKPAPAPLLTFRHHLILVAITVLLVTGAVYGVESLIAKHDAANSTKWTSLLDAEAAQTKTLQTQITADEAAAAIRDAAYQKTISQLAQTISVRNTQVAQQVKNDATLDAQAAAVRLDSQTQAAPGEIVAANDSVTLDLPVTRRVVASLDLLPVAQADLADTEKQLAAQQGLTSDALADDDAQKKLVSAQAQMLVDSSKACDATVKAVKASARKGKLKWFGIGFVAGFVSGVTAHLW